jgi:hypothetical protein
MLAIGHFIIGYSSVILLAIILGRRNPFVYPLAYMGGLWALIPDLFQLRVTPDFLKGFVRDLHTSSAANLFFLHKYLDQIYRYEMPDNVTIYLLGGLLLTIFYTLNPSPIERG